MKTLIQNALLSAEMHPDRVGERITAMRMALGQNKAQFADSLTLDRSTLTKVEAGKKGLDIAVAVRIAEMYGFGLDYTYRGILTDAPEALRSELIAALHATRFEKFEAKARST